MGGGLSSKTKGAAKKNPRAKRGRRLPLTTDELVDLAVALFADATVRGDIETANAAAGIALDLTAQVRYAMGLLEGAGTP